MDQLITLYIVLGLILTVGISTLVLTILIYKNIKRSNAAVTNHPNTEPGIVFCRNCGNQFISSHSTCPVCHMPR